MIWLAACAPEPAPQAGTPIRVRLERASLDLRGVRPTVDELEAVEADPAALDELVDRFLADPRFPGRARELWRGALDTRRDVWPVGAADFGLTDEPGFAVAVGEEPLRIVERIAAEDRPWTEVVTADWTLADPNLAAAYPLDRDPGDGWQPARYTDGRPSAGVLSTNGMWWRYGSTEGNANRGRANAISRSLLCRDYLALPIVFDRNIDLTDQDAVRDAIHTNPGCVACHATLDPIAAYLFGFYQYLDYAPSELTQYHAERERLWDERLGVAPSWYGEPGLGLADLGRQIAADPGLLDCAVQRVAEATATDPGELRDSFVAGGATLRPLFRAAALQDRPEAVRLLPVDTVASLIEDLTGYRLAVGGVDQLGSDLGLRTLAGGSALPSTTSLLVDERVAEAAAASVVATDLADPVHARLFVYTSPDVAVDADPDAAVAEIRYLHLRLFTDRIAADGPEVAANLALWRDLAAIDGSAEHAWTALLAALLRDPELVVYR